MALGFTFMIIVYWLFRRSSPDRVDRFFRRGQLFSAGLYSLGHGTNDAQKTMGIIFILLIASGRLPQDSHVPIWVVLSCHAAMGFGTLFGGYIIGKF
jgi:PiT family inorganic phosphate transporter